MWSLLNESRDPLGGLFELQKGTLRVSLRVLRGNSGNDSHLERRTTTTTLAGLAGFLNRSDQAARGSFQYRKGYLEGLGLYALPLSG